jgi:Flp pilus assembly protein TadD
VILVVVVVLLTRGGGGNAALSQGVDAYRRGQREVAVNAFNRAVRENPKMALPHVYLARMAREVGNFTLASQELQLALEAEPSNAVALREMGANLLTQGNYELARRFYVRAVQANPTDTTAQGYLGCTLMRLNRTSEATNFLNRAGPGPWSNCTPAQPSASGDIPRP